jgi:hypothetical protein
MQIFLMLTARNTRSVEGKYWVLQELMVNASLDVNILKIILEGSVHLYHYHLIHL